MAALERLHFLLSMATSQNPENLKEAENGLSQLETQPRFHVALLVILSLPFIFLISVSYSIFFSQLLETGQSILVFGYNLFFILRME